ncbi:MAG TPA: hypothetical protein VEQ58_21040, partial [Polyangiaceae bacterium]|nr:hypothetical protein [Polyangiaceae bacterium]
HGSLVYLLAFLPGATTASIGAEARGFDAAHARGLPRPASYTNLRDSQRRLRIGYVSPDFRAHPVASFLPEVLKHHDRSQVEVFCYSNVRKPDAVTEQLRGLGTHWREIASLSDDAAAALISRDQIDVLIDLAMHSAGSRPLLFARKPAPVQACWLAYPGTTGLDAIDYRVTDSIIDPPGAADEGYSERSRRLRGCFWCYSPPPGFPALSELPALSAGHVTFGSPNSFKKVSDVALELWASVLEAVPSSRMLIVAPEGRAWQRVEGAFAARGVDASRLERLPHVPRPQYLASLLRMDCVLDTAPYNGGTASFDALHSGVPVVSLAGASASARSGASILHHLGLPKLVATTSAGFVETARALVNDLPELAVLRAGLRDRLDASGLTNPTLFARDLERSFREMFQAWASAAPVRG